MSLDKEIVRWVEYSICECAMEIFPKSNSFSTTFHSFCERIKESILRNNLSKREMNILNTLMNKTNRIYRLSDAQISTVCCEFFIDGKWEKYVRVIELMKDVRWNLPNDWPKKIYV